jgi:hypothetical protein
MNAGVSKLGLAKCWLDAEIELEDFGIGPARWVVLWVLTLAGGLIPEGEWKALQMTIPTLFIAGFWHESALIMKLGLSAGFSLVSFLNAYLPIPGFSYGYLASSAHWLTEEGALSWLVALAGIYCGAAVILIILLHFMPHVCRWCGVWPAIPGSVPASQARNRWPPVSPGAITAPVKCSRGQTICSQSRLDA